MAILGRLLPKSIVGLSGKEDRGPSVDKVTDFDHMLAFAFPAGIHGNGGGVLEVNLHFLQRVTRLQGLMLARLARQDVTVLA